MMELEPADGVYNWDSKAPCLISGPNGLWRFTRGLVNRRFPKNHFHLLSNTIADCIYFLKTVIDLQLHSGHPFHLFPTSLTTVSQVAGLMGSDRLDSCQFHVGYLNFQQATTAATLSFPQHDLLIALKTCFIPSPSTVSGVFWSSEVQGCSLVSQHMNQAISETWIKALKK